MKMKLFHIPKGVRHPEIGGFCQKMSGENY
ncbi:hypothetical protein JOC48_003236 [Aquibacillus albus]|uniref:Uncharacterized protein n=1 Tax=Aquibacillus albus TaxID=1168171 RepID=A0ABS2N3I9_9BACI|nr:hypothetical protein [Aquibacillus albus]